jgi:hypothetical protein
LRSLIHKQYLMDTMLFALVEGIITCLVFASL